MENNSDAHNSECEQRKDLTLEDLKKRKLKIFDHPHLKEPCFRLGLEQREQLKACPVWQSFLNQQPIVNDQYTDTANSDQQNPMCE